MLNYGGKTPVAIGDTITIECPCSEVCMYMRVAGKIMQATIVDGGNGLPMVQLLQDDGRFFSFPITYGEGGIYRDDNGTYYYYPPKAEEVSA